MKQPICLKNVKLHKLTGLINNQGMAKRQCFPCTACCQGWLMAEINGVEMMPGTPCVHAGETGCGIYEKRPENPCVLFNCYWMHERSKLPDHMKPSECGAIVIVDRNWRNWKVIRVIPMGNEVPGKTLQWLMAFAQAQSTPLLLTQHQFKNGKYFGNKRAGFGPPEFTHALETEIWPEDNNMCETHPSSLKDS